jgi:hypothetical protein
VEAGFHGGTKPWLPKDRRTFPTTCEDITNLRTGWNDAIPPENCGRAQKQLAHRKIFAEKQESMAFQGGFFNESTRGPAARDDYDGDRGESFLKQDTEINAVHSGDKGIYNRELGFPPGDRFEGMISGIDCAAFIAFVLEDLGKRVGHYLVVVDK